MPHTYGFNAFDVPFSFTGAKCQFLTVYKNRKLGGHTQLLMELPLNPPAQRRFYLLHIENNPCLSLLIGFSNSLGLKTFMYSIYFIAILNYFSFSFGGCVCLYVCKCVCCNATVCTCLWREKDNLRCHSSGIHLDSFKTGSLTGLEIAKQTRLLCLQTSVVCPSLPPQSSDSKCSPVRSVFSSYFWELE